MLLSVSVLSVSVGTVFWATIAFLIVMIILRKFAWKPILAGLNAREESIDNALNEAKKAREEMANLKSSNEQLLREAREERDVMLKEARDVKDKILAEAREKAQEQSDRIITLARAEIDIQKKAAVAEIKQQVALLSLDIAEKVVRAELSNDERQRELVKTLLNDVKFN